MESLKKTGKTPKNNEPSKQDVRLGLTILGLFVLFILLVIASGFWETLAMYFLFGAGYLVYRAIRHKDSRRVSLIWSAVLFAAFVVAMPPTEPATQEALVAREKTQAQDEDAASKKKTEEANKPKEGVFYQVAGITDGDTLKVKIGDKTEKVRVIGINTPETQNKKQCFGKEASSKMQSLAQSKKVRLEADSSQDDRDRYGRLLRFVFLEDGTDIGKTLVSEGFAHEYIYSKPYKYASAYKLAESDAKTRALGFWAAETCGGNTNQTPEQATQAIQAKKKAEEEAAAQAAAAVQAQQAQQAAAAEAARQQQIAQQQAAQAQQQQQAASNVFYKNCTAARAAGAAPVYRGQPGYASHLDRDNDGIGCE